MLYLDTTLNHIVIEGSSEKEKAGEYVIDVSEYSKSKEGNKSIAYFQLKHTSVRGDQPMNLSDLKDTLEGFADKFRQLRRSRSKEITNFSFHIITNRKINEAFKQKLVALTRRQAVDKRFAGALKKYTKLKGKQLADFCTLLDIQDGEGDYNVQNTELRMELSQLIAGIPGCDGVMSKL